MLSHCYASVIRLHIVNVWDKGHQGDRKRGHLLREEELCSLKGQLEDSGVDPNNVLVLGVDVISGRSMKAALNCLERQGVTVSAVAALYWSSDEHEIRALIKKCYYHEEREREPRYPWVGPSSTLPRDR